MQGCKCLALVAVFLTTIIFSACSHNYHKADCFDCVDEYQEWNEFSWEKLKGTWRGSLEIVKNDINAKAKERTEQAAELSFVDGADFLKVKSIAECKKFPEQAVVLIGQVWDSGSAKERVYEVFGKRDDGNVSYGRAVVNGTKCNYVTLDRAMGMNRLALPAVDFTQRKTKNGRVLASGVTPETEVNFEFLNFDTENVKKLAFVQGSRMPASVPEQDKPPLMFRVFQMERIVDSPYSRGKWQHTEEHLYRLWKVK